MRISRLLSLFVTLAAFTLLAAAPGASAAGHAKHPKHGKHAKKAVVRSLSGTVTKVGKGNHSFRMKTKRGAAVKVIVGRSTKGVKHVVSGQSVVVRARRTRGGWVAARITRIATPATDDTADDTDSMDDNDPIFDDDSDTSADDTPVDGDDNGTDYGDDGSGAGDSSGDGV